MSTQQESQVSTSIDEHLERLLAFEATTLPVISLYLNAQADDRGRTNFESFLKRELIPRAKTFSSGSAERQSFDADLEKIQKYLDDELKASANGIAIFACSGSELFEAIQLNAPLEDNYLYVYNQPHLYHLTRLDDAYPRYAALVTDANTARIFVFGLGETLETEQVKGKKVQRVKVGGWSQARYQRRVENAHASHAKEAIETLDKIVRQDNIKHVILAGDPQMAPVLQEHMPKHLADKLVDVMKLDLKASDQDVFQATLDRMREEDAKTDAEKVDRLLRSYRGSGMAVVGAEATLEALANGQVDELLISAGLEEMHGEEEPIDAILAPEVPDSSGGTESDEPRQVLLADLLVTKAKQTDATVSFIEDATLLADVGGVGAFLRWQS
ncbi:MAG TPA: VLRF1 family aeRF1-type release factor [Bryobacteraceae bacterium]|nr:VLRF1 family aeRF1-type release factor [Bryobacteraceae bacterium]